MRRPIILIWLVIVFSWSGVIWLINSGDTNNQITQNLIFILLTPALGFLISFFVFVARLVIRRGQDERIVYKSSFWWTMLFVMIFLTYRYLDAKKLMDLVNFGALAGIGLFGSMFLRLSLKRGY